MDRFIGAVRTFAYDQAFAEGRPTLRTNGFVLFKDRSLLRALQAFTPADYYSATAQMAAVKACYRLTVRPQQTNGVQG